MQSINEELSEKLRRGEIKGHYRSPLAEAKYLSKLQNGKLENKKNIGLIQELGATGIKSFLSERKCASCNHPLWLLPYGSEKDLVHQIGASCPVCGIACALEGRVSPNEFVHALHKNAPSGAVKCGCKIDALLNFPPTPGFGPWKKYFDPKAVEHPAKANLYLVDYLIRTFTKPGETVLDPMAGTYSTCVVAARAGRRSIGLELEKRFYGWGIETKKRTAPKLPMLLLKGDARKLSKILHKKLGIAISSPPYSDVMSADKRGGVISPYMHGLIHRLSGIPPRAFAHDYDLLVEAMSRARHKIPAAYSKDPENIGNLQHGTIDTIATSVPFGKGGGEGGGKGIGAHGYISEKGVDLDLHKRHDRSYGLDPQNISNLNIGKIDYVVQSPPYGDSFLAGGGRRKRNGRLKLQGYNNAAYVSGRARNTVLGHYDGGVPRKEQIGLMKKETYLEAMFKVYQECYKVLRAEGLLILIIKDFLRHKKVVYLHEDTLKLCILAGFSLEEHLLSKISVESFWRISYRKKYPDIDVSALQYEHILVLRKRE